MRGNSAPPVGSRGTRLTSKASTDSNERGQHSVLQPPLGCMLAWHTHG